MRKLFTSVMAALCLAAPASTLSAQNQQLTEAQKEAFKKEVMPVIFEQIKEQAGIDILGWANPSLSNTFAGIPVLESSNLRAASAEAISVKPDSIVIDATKLGLPIGDAKIFFEGYDTKELPFVSISGRPVTVDMPAKIIINALGMDLGSIDFVSDITATGFTADVNFSLPLFSLNNEDILACSLGLNGANLEANVDIQEGLIKTVNAFGVTEVPAGLQTDYLVTVGIGGLITGTSNQIPASLYAVNATSRVSMGDAVVTLNPTNTFPIQRIDVTPYSNGTAGTPYYFDLNMSVSNQVYRLEVDKYKDATENADLDKTTIITTSGAIAPTIFGGIQDLVNSVITRAVSELAENAEATWFQMVIDEQPAGGEVANIATITVEPGLTATAATADINVTVGTTTYTVTAAADLTGSNVISVTMPNGLGAAYFTSNIAGIITANESVEETVATMKVVPTENAIRVTNVDKGTYRIVSMTGAIVASGHINGDTYIPTASLSQGIYIVAVEADGVMQSVKIKR